MTAGPEPSLESLVRQSMPQRLAKRLVRLAAVFAKPASAALYRRRPGAALAFGALAGRLVARLHQPVPAALLARLLGEPLAPRHRTLAREIACSKFRKALIWHWLYAHGIEPLTQVLRWTGRERLLALHSSGRPAIIAMTHCGPSVTNLAAFYEAGVPLMSMGVGDTMPKLPDSLGMLAFKHSPEARALQLKAGLDHLRKGGFLSMAVDGQHGPLGDGPGLFGTNFRLRKGIAILYRLSGAPVVPVTAIWGANGREIEVIVEDPLPFPDPTMSGPEIEAAMQRTLHSWLEAHLRAHAGQMPSQLVLRECFGLTGRRREEEPLGDGR